MPIQKKTGYEPPENAYRGDSGAFVVTLVNITAPREVESSYDGETRKRKVEEWQFALEDGQMVWDPWVTHFDGESLSDRSKTYEYAAALVGGSAILEQRVFPNVADLADLRAKLIGRQAIASIDTSGDGPAKIDNLGPLPPSMLQQPAQAPAAAPQPVQQPQPAPAPVAQPVQQPQPVQQAAPLREQVAGELDGLPF